MDDKKVTSLPTIDNQAAFLRDLVVIIGDWTMPVDDPFITMDMNGEYVGVQSKPLRYAEVINLAEWKVKNNR